MKILTQNLYYRREWDLKKEPFISNIKQINPDIVCFQEITGRKVNNNDEYIYEGIEAQKALGYEGYYSTGIIHAPNQGTYLRPDTFEVIDKYEISFSGILPTGEIDKHRRFLLAQLVKVNGKELVIANLHLSVDKNFRYQNWKEFLIWLESRGYEDKNIIVAGDFNNYDDEDVYSKVIESGFKDAWKEVREDECITYYGSKWWVENQPNDGQSKYILESGKSWEDNCLDFVFYKGDIKINSAEYLDLVPKYTDHRGVVVDFNI